MNIYASSASQRNGAREAHHGAAEAPAHEMKYRQDVAGYVAAMLAELRQIAGKAGFDKLVKSIDAAYYDAYGALDAKAREATPPPREEVTAGAPRSAPEKTSESMEPNGA